MIRANASGLSNQTSASPAGESAGVEAEGQEEDLREFVVDEPDESPAMDDGPDLVRSYLLYECSCVEPCVGRHRTGHVVCHDPSRRDGPHSISQTLVLLQHLWC